MLRYGLLAGMLTWGVACFWQAFPGWAALWQGGVLWWLLPGLAAALLAGRLGDPWLSVWRTFWLGLLAGIWLAATGSEVLALLSNLESGGAVAVRLLQKYALSSSVFLGFLTLLGKKEVAPEALPLTLLSPGLVALLVLLNPAGHSLSWLPLVAASGLLPYGLSPSPEATRWRHGPAALVEMLSLQCVAWGALLSALSFLLELQSRGVIMALFVGSSTGCLAWLGSGLLWGVALNLRQGRLPLARLASLLFGR